MKSYIILVAIFLAGCAQQIKPITYTPIQAFDIDKLSAMQYLDLCKDYYTLNNVTKQLTPNSKKQYEEVLISKGLPKKDLEKIKENKIYIGMSQCGLYASWGKPKDENKTVNRNGVRIQHVYGYSLSNRNYVYTENGKISSWQN